MSEFIFTVNDVPIESNRTISAEDIIKRLLANNIWLFGEKTPMLKRLNLNDKVLIYVCGPERRYFYGIIQINSQIKQYSQDDKACELAEELGLVWMIYYCTVKVIKIFKKPIYIKPLIDKLNFLTEKKNYGLNLRHPIILISSNDYELIIGQDVNK